MLTKILPIPKHPEEQLQSILADGISSLDLSQRTVNSLERNGVRSVSELMNCCDQPPEECRKHCKCLEAFNDDPEKRRTWLPKCYLREIPGFADITVERIREAVKKKIASIR